MKMYNFSKLIGIIIGLSLIFSCSVTAAVDSGQSSDTDHTPVIITTDLVKNNIQKFSGLQNQVITYTGTKDFPIGKMYEVTTDTGDRYYVNVNTGDIEVAMVHNAIPVSTSMTAKDIESIKESVQKFVEKNYRNFNTKKMVLTDSKIIDHGDAGNEYVFYWNEMSGEVYTLSSVKVSVYPTLNNTVTYVGFDRPLLVNTIPHVSQTDAESIILRTFKMATTATTSSKLVVIPSGDNQKLVWLVDTVEQDKEGFSHGGMARVDAISGEVISLDPFI